MPYSAASRSPCVPLPPPDGDPRQEHLQELEDVPEFADAALPCSRAGCMRHSSL